MPRNFTREYSHRDLCLCARKKLVVRVDFPKRKTVPNESLFHLSISVNVSFGGWVYRCLKMVRNYSF